MKYQIIETEGKSGCKDENGSWVLMPEYGKMELCVKCIVCWKNEIIQVYNLETKSFLLECEEIRKDKDGYWAFRSEGKWGVFSTSEYDSGRIIIHNYYEDVKQLKGNLYSVHHDGYYEIANSPDCYARHFDAHPIYYNYRRLLAKKGDKYGFINSFNYTTIPFIYDEIIERWDDDFDVRIGNSWGILSLDGREVVQVKYNRKVFNPNYYNRDIDWQDFFDIVKDSRSGREGIIDRQGKEVIPPIYDSASVISMKSMPLDWTSLLPKIYSEKYPESNVFLLKATAIDSEDYYGDSETSSGLFDISGNLIVPVAYESFSYIAKGFIIASKYQDQLFEIYNIKEGGKCLISGIDRIFIDDQRERLYLFRIKERKFIEKGTLDILDYCIPIDFSLKTILKDSDGECLQIDPETEFTSIPKQFSIDLGGIENKIDYYCFNEYRSIIIENSIIFKRGEKNGVCYLNSQSFSPLYDELIDQFDDDLFIIRDSGRSGLLYKGKEILQPIYYGISTVEDGFCFVIKKNYSLFDIDFVNIENIAKSHITAFRGLSEEEVMQIIRGNYLYFQVRKSEVFFNKECPFPITTEFQQCISKERIPLIKDSWSWGVY